MKLVIVFSGAHRRGGVERVVWEALRYFGAHHEVWFVGGELESPERLPDGIRHIKISADVAARPVKFRRAAASALAEIDSDTVLTFGANCPPGDVCMVGSVHLAWLNVGRPIPVQRFRIPAKVRFLMPRHRQLLKLERSYFRAPGKRTFVAVGDQVNEDLIRLYNVAPTAIVTIPNGFSKSEFSPARRASHYASIRTELKIAEAEIALLFVGNELHRKGFGVLLEAVAKCQDPRVVVHVVGKADIHPYSAMIGRLGLVDNVRWHGATNDVARFFAAADLFVLPTQYEPFGIVIIEALAMGVPVITTRLAGAAPAVDGSGAGMLQIDPDDPHALEGETLNEWGRHAPAAAAPYEWTEIMRRIEALL
jgi:UDP-glucose:(heptosyl)LPS alpha-1,3-glucosyltransferase